MTLVASTEPMLHQSDRLIVVSATVTGLSIRNSIDERGAEALTLLEVPAQQIRTRLQQAHPQI